MKGWYFEYIINGSEYAEQCSGAFGVMLSILLKVGFSPMGVKAITVALFILVTSPVAAHMISRAAHRHGVGLCKESVIDEYGKACEAACPPPEED
ncbi:MAG: multicomponent Na+:H+ antiporter subunit [Methanolobus sp.]|nr:multicomponent Na+:H+ antiporter subunit [Methanolobus sp.]